MKPLLRWAGGKSWLAPLLDDLYQPFSHLPIAEPFAGGAAFSFYSEPRVALLNDYCTPVANMYSAIKLARYFTLSPSAWKDFNTQEGYAYLREGFNMANLCTKLDRSCQDGAGEAFYLLNRLCYNGLCRFNKKGEFNVPWGKLKKPLVLEDFSVYRQLMECWSFTSLDFTDAISRLPERTFLFADPPYVGGFDSYTSNGFSWDQQRQLVDLLAVYPGPTVATNAAFSDLETLYEDHGFTVYNLQAPRRISCDGNRDAVGEMLAVKNIQHSAVEAALDQRGMKWCHFQLS